MKILFEEIKKRFPEIHKNISECDEDLPYVLMSYVVWWLKSLNQETLTHDIVNRVVDFTKWCETQPRGKNSSDDIYTVLTVSFYEKLFDSEVTRKILPKLIQRAELIASEDYFKAWIGNENYEKALKEYK